MRIVDCDNNYSFDSIRLNYVPNCISIAPNGNSAVIGHDAHISYVNLSSKTAIRTVDIDKNVFDIVMSDNEWAYVFPRDDYGVYSVNLVDGTYIEEDYQYRTSYNSIGTLHPSGNYIISQVEAGSGLLNDWGIEKITIE